VVAVSYVRALGLGGQRATLEELVVDPKRRGTGVGRQLAILLRLAMFRVCSECGEAEYQATEACRAHEMVFVSHGEEEALPVPIAHASLAAQSGHDAESKRYFKTPQEAAFHIN